MSDDFPGRSKATHGTRAGFQMHGLQHTDVCKACDAANKAYNNRYYIKNKWRRAK